ncbi:MAG: HK97 gp10 family phage protein [Clostridiales bacterium]|nr:HK97 gp10 family phage protein [Clostridiales bacterium]
MEYNDLAADTVKKAVKAAGTTVRNEIRRNAPEQTGRYAKSWTSKTTAESATSMQVTVYSPSRYMLAHLLEHGHPGVVSHRNPAGKAGQQGCAGGEVRRHRDREVCPAL